jgi:hypothetical protein
MRFYKYHSLSKEAREIDMTDGFERMKRQVEDEMDLGGIWAEEYKAVLAKEIAREVRERERKEAKEDIRQRSAGKTRISR